MINLSEAKNLTRPVIQIACAGQTLAGYKCEQRGECACHAAIGSAEMIEFRQMMRDEFTGYCPAIASIQ